MTSLQNYHQRIVYILTYSRADVSRFPTQLHSADAVVDARKSYGIEISHSVVSIEGHARPRKSRQQRGLPVYNITQLIRAKKITTSLELVCLAVEQSPEGKCELSQFIVNRNNKVDDALEVAKEFPEAETKLLHL